MDGGDLILLAVIGYGFYSCISSDDKTAETKDNKPEVVVESNIGVQDGRGMVATPEGRFPPAPAALKPQEWVEQEPVPDADDLFEDIFDETLFD